MRVSLVGAGPGDKGLLTIKGAERIQNADVVVFDSLISEEILAMIPDSAEKIDAGKNAGHHPVSQEEISRLLLEKARQGLEVVRLKGGDPFVFGRGGEELELLAENNIPFEVIPGVSSAIAGAAYAGIPVTHRDYASSLHIITGHAKKSGDQNIDQNINYETLVRTKGTLVFVMGLGAIEKICAGCINAGMNKDKPAAIVENATTNKQRKFLGTVETLPEIARTNAVISPALIIIGEVCRLSTLYDWFSKKPLLGRQIIVARTKRGASTLSDKLRELGCFVRELPCANIVPLTAPGCLLEKKLNTIKNYSWLVFTSSIGVTVFFDYLLEKGFDIRALHHLKIACVGAETEKEINKRLIKAAYRPTEYNGAALARGLSALIKKGEKVLIVRAKDSAEDLTQLLTEADVDFEDLAIYEKIHEAKKTTNIRKALSISGTLCSDFAAFTSSSSVDWFVQNAVDIDLKKIKAVCIGERTAATAKSYGMEVHVSTEASIESMVNKIKELCL